MMKSLILIFLLGLVSCGHTERENNIARAKAKLHFPLDSKSPTHVGSWESDSIYFFLMDKFVDGDPSNNRDVDPDNVLKYKGGDLKGLTENLDYISRLGLNTLLFTPIVQNREGQFFGHFASHGYWILDHYKVDSRFGTMKDLENFNRVRQQKKMRLLIDLVLNHVDVDHPWVKEHPTWFHPHVEVNQSSNDETAIIGSLGGTADLAQENEEVYQELFKYATFWIDTLKPDGIRLDALKHIELGYWKRFTTDIKAHVKNDNFLMIGEFLHGDPEAYRPYINAGINGFFDYPLYYTVLDVFARDKSMKNLAARLINEDKVFKNIQLVTFIDNHDTPRFLSVEEDVGPTDMYQALFFNHVIRGIPMIYSGTESQMRGVNGEEGRQLLNLKRTPSFGMMKRIQKLRSRHPSLHSTTLRNIMVNDNYYVFQKLSADEEAIIVIARSERNFNLDFPLPACSLFNKKRELEDTLTSRVFPITKEGVKLKVRSKDQMAFFAKGQSPCLKEAPLEGTFLMKITLSGISGDVSKVVMTGSREQIGRWNPSNGLELKKNVKGEYVAEISMPKGDVFEFKFLKIFENGKQEWEDHRDNRVLYVNKDKTLLYDWDK